eukprot:3916132-Rhodomonas_salina.1
MTPSGTKPKSPSLSERLHWGSPGTCKGSSEAGFSEGACKSSQQQTSPTGQTYCTDSTRPPPGRRL